MPIKNPFKKKFEQKRKALGVSRKEGDTRTYSPIGARDKGPLKIKISANPKIRKIATTYEATKLKFENEVKKTGNYKPKNEMEARKRQEKLAILEQEIKDLRVKTLNKIDITNLKRIASRKNRQSKIIEEKLLKIITDSIYFKRNALPQYKNRILSWKYDPVKLRKNYQYFLKNKNKTFADITFQDAVDILETSVIIR